MVSDIVHLKAPLAEALLANVAHHLQRRLGTERCSKATNDSKKIPTHAVAVTFLLNKLMPSSTISKGLPGTAASGRLRFADRSPRFGVAQGVFERLR